MRNCFVPFCDFECRANPKRMMFICPKNDKLFQLWTAALPKRRILKKTDKVCERHFNPSEISTTFDHVIKGEHFTMARGKPKLKDFVIPSRNLPDDNYFVVKRGRKAGCKMIKKSKVKQKRQTMPQSDSLEEAKLKETIQYLDPPKITQSHFNENISLNDETDSAPHRTNLCENIFETLYDDIFEVVLPNTLWGIHRDPDKKFLAFSYYDPGSRKTSKIIEITNQGLLKVFIQDKIISEDCYNSEMTHEKISNLVNKIDEATLDDV